MNRSKRGIKRLVEKLAEEYGPEPEWEVTSSVRVVMEREKAEAEGREIVEELGESTRVVTWYDADGNAVGGSPESKVSDGADLVAVRPE